MDEIHFRTLSLIEKNGMLPQRELSRIAGLSLGRINNILGDLTKMGYIKVERFKNSNNRIANRYILTRKGRESRAAQADDFLKIKLDQFEKLRSEIEALRREADGAAEYRRI